MQFKITKVVGNDTTVQFTFDDESTLTQTIASVPSTEEDAKVFLTNWANAYLAGKAVESANAPVDLVGQTLQA